MGETRLRWCGICREDVVVIREIDEEFIQLYSERWPDAIYFFVDQLEHVLSPEQIRVYLLAEDNYPELATHTGLPEKKFREMAAWDAEFGITSKIYLIPVQQ